MDVASTATGPAARADAVDPDGEVAPADAVTAGGSAPAPTPRPARPPWLAPALVAGGALATCAFVYGLNPVEESNPPICPFKMMTGQDCPGCGATRALAALLHGHPGVAADHNLLFVLALPVVIVGFVVWALHRLGVRRPDWHLPRHWFVATAVVVSLFWALRLLPWDPFTWLASGA